MFKQVEKRSLLTTPSDDNSTKPNHRAPVWNRHGRVVIPQPAPIDLHEKSEVTLYISTVALLIVGWVLKPTVLAVCRFRFAASRITGEVAMVDLHQKLTGTQYTATVALLALGLLSPVLLIVSLPFGYISVSLAVAFSALCAASAWLSWNKYSQLTIPSLETPYARSK